MFDPHGYTTNEATFFDIEIHQARGQLADSRRRSRPVASFGFAEIVRVAFVTPDALERRAAALVEYGNSLPEGVTTEAFAEAANLRHKAWRLRGE